MALLSHMPYLSPTIAFYLFCGSIWYWWCLLVRSIWLTSRFLSVTINVVSVSSTSSCHVLPSNYSLAASSQWDYPFTSSISDCWLVGNVRCCCCYMACCGLVMMVVWIHGHSQIENNDYQTKYSIQVYVATTVACAWIGLSGRCWLIQYR